MHSVSSFRRGPRAKDHILDLDVLEPGDIVLSTTGEAVSRSIRFLTNSPYSHAMLYVGNTLIHADGGGVFSLNPQRKIVGQGEIAVYRLRERPDDVAMTAVINHARNEIGCLYSVPHALLVGVMKLWGRDRSGKQFCSRLVAQAYHQAGHPLVRNPDYCSPGALARSTRLAPVEHALRPVNDVDLRIAATTDQLLVHQHQTFEWLRWVRSAARRKGHRISRFNSALDFIQAHPDVDEEAARQLQACGYLQHYLVDESANAYRYSCDAFIDHCGPTDHAIAQELKIARDMAARVISAHRGAALRPATRTFALLRELHRNRAGQLVRRLDVIQAVAARHGLLAMAGSAHALKTQLLPAMRAT